jgi:hypothetical protein
VQKRESVVRKEKVNVEKNQKKLTFLLLTQSRSCVSRLFRALPSPSSSLRGAPRTHSRTLAPLREKSSARLKEQKMPAESALPFVLISIMVAGMGSLQQGVHKLFNGKPKPVCVDAFDRAAAARDKKIREEAKVSYLSAAAAAAAARTRASIVFFSPLDLDLLQTHPPLLLLLLPKLKNAPPLLQH